MAATFTYEVPVVEVVSVYPNTGPLAGGTAIEIFGRGFQAGATVEIGGDPATDIAVVSDSRITAETPAEAAGSYDLTVTNTDTGTDTLADAFTYQAAPPTRRFSYRTLAGAVGTGMRLAGMRISQTIGQPASCSFTATLQPSGNQMVQFDAFGQELFTGVVTRVLERTDGAEKQQAWDTEGLDGAHLLDRLHPEGEWTNTSATTVIQTLLSDSGFSPAGIAGSLPNVTVMADGTQGTWTLIVDICNRIGAKCFVSGTTVYVFLTDSGFDPPAPVTDGNPDLLWPSSDQAATIDTDYGAIINRVIVKGAEGISVSLDDATSIAAHGLREMVIYDNTLETDADILALAQVELAARKDPIRTVRYATRDLKTRAGKTVSITLTKPAISGTFLIQTCEIDQLDLLVASPPTKPRFSVTAALPVTSMRRAGGTTALLSKVIDLAAKERQSPKLDGAITSPPGGPTVIPDGSIPASALAGCIPGTALLPDTITTTQIAEAVFTDLNRRGTRGDQPDADAVDAGTLYYVTDEGVTERSNGTIWEDVTDAKVVSTYDAPLTNGDPATPELVFDSFGDVVMVTGIPL